MVERGGYLACSATGMELSLKAREALEEFVRSEPRGVQDAPSHPGTAAFRCPVDGADLTSDGRCEACGRQLPWAVHYNLIELHHHP